MTSKVFVDSSVLFSAVISFKGYARDLIRYGIAGRVQLVTSNYVLAEVAKNLTDKQPKAAYILDQIVKTAGWLIIDATREEVWAAAEYTVLKDAPVVAAAVKAECEYLVTFDRKHLLNPSEVAKRSGLIIAMPEIVARKLFEADE